MKNRSAPPRPRAGYWWCQAGGWSAYLAVNLITSQGFIGLTWRLASGYVFLSAIGLLFTHGFRRFLLDRGWLDLPVRRLVPRVVAVNLLFAIVLVALVTVYYLLVPPGGHPSDRRDVAAVVATWFVFVFNSFIIFILWSGIYFGVAYVRRQRRLEIERYQAQTALAEAELRGLKSQLNPHFFFNSLNSLRALVLEDPARAQDAITQLAAILRYHLQSGERSLVPLAEEVETVEQYLALELIRFEDRLTIERALEPAALAILVPPLALQTLVENAVKYGVSRDTGPGVIRLGARVEGDRLEVVVANTGSIHPTAGNQSIGLGLTNLRTRLRLLFDTEGSCELHELASGWVEARLILPARTTNSLTETGLAEAGPSGATSFRSSGLTLFAETADR